MMNSHLIIQSSLTNSTAQSKIILDYILAAMPSTIDHATNIPTILSSVTPELKTK